MSRWGKRIKRNQKAKTKVEPGVYYENGVRIVDSGPVRLEGKLKITGK